MYRAAVHRTITHRAAPSWAHCGRRRPVLQRAGRCLLGVLPRASLGAVLLVILFSAVACARLGGYVLDLRPDPADRLDHHRGSTAWHGGSAGTRRRRPMPARPLKPRLARMLPHRSGFGLGSGSALLEIAPADYEAFEAPARRASAAVVELGCRQAVTRCDARNGVVFPLDLVATRRATNQHVLRPQLRRRPSLEAWREAIRLNASCRWRYALVDKPRPSHRPAGLGGEPGGGHWKWTFARPRVANWYSSAIHQT